MERKEIVEGMQGVFAAMSETEEWDAALAFANRLREAGMQAEVTFRAPNAAERLTLQDGLAAPEAVAVLSIGDEVFVWQPKARKSIDAFFLE